MARRSPAEEIKYQKFWTGLRAEILKVLAKAALGRDRQRHYMTSYQIIARLPARWRNELLYWEGSKYGRGAQSPHTAASRLGGAIAADLAHKVDIEWLDSRGTRFTKDRSAPADVTDLVKPGVGVVGLYRVAR